MQPISSNPHTIVGILALMSIGAAATLLVACASPQSYEGREVFVINCSNCHGLYGAGDGPLASDLPVVLPDLRDIRDGDGMFPREVVRVIIDGRGRHAAYDDMPRWGEVFGKDADAKIDALVEYLHLMQRTRDDQRTY